jgi:hypothetical protein
MELHPGLKASIDCLYQTFSAYLLPDYTDPCLHCHTIEDDSKLRSKPLHDLGVEELRDYIADALLVWGSVSDFKHFLPRIFELYVTVPDPASELIDPEMILSKFRYGQWRTWPHPEQLAIESFLQALWAQILNDPPQAGCFTDVESWLCAIAQAEDDLTPYLNQWIHNQNPSASFALSSMLLSSAVVRPGSTGRNAFWEDRDKQYVQVQDWIKTPDVLRKLEAARTTAPDSSSESEFEAAIQILT